jgi:hypothetical protein
MALKRRWQLGLLLATCAPACNSLLGIEEGRPRRTTTAAGGEPNAAGESSGGQSSAGKSSTGEGGASGQADTCQHARWPTRPPPSGSASSVWPDLVFAAKSINLTDRVDLGRDLDNSCTCPAPSTCVAPGSGDLVCDAPDGRDASVNKVLATLVQGGLSAFSQEKIQQEVSEGRAGLALRIRGYNRKADDDLVSVEVFGKVSHTGALAHDGLDQWSPYRDSVQPLEDKDQAIDWASHDASDWATDGYVRNFVLVARLPHLALALRPNVGFNDNPLIIELTDAVLSGKLEPGPDETTFTAGNVAGRWATTTALQAFGALQYPDFLCPSGDPNQPNVPYESLRTNACKYADIMSAESRDNRDADCDAISWAAGFEAEPAQLGDLMTPELVPSTCPKDEPPSCFD